MWVPSGGRKPQLVNPEFEGHVDLDYLASEVQQNPICVIN